MATKELDTPELLEQTLPTTPTELDLECKLSPGKKKLGPNNPDQMEQFVTETTKVVECFLQNLLNSEPCAIKEAYQVLITEYHQYLWSIEDYFCDTDRTVVFDIIDDTSCEVLKMEKAKEADREKCPDPRTSTDNLMTGNHTLSHLAALPNFESHIPSCLWCTAKLSIKTVCNTCIFFSIFPQNLSFSSNRNFSS